MLSFSIFTAVIYNESIFFKKPESTTFKATPNPLIMAEGRFTNPVVASLAGVRDFFARQQLASRFSDRDRAGTGFGPGR